MASSFAYQENVGHGFAGIAPPIRGEKMFEHSKVYDVFINHRGPDVKDTLATNLYFSLRRMSIEAFLDSEDLQYGGFFPSEITNAINSVSFQIAIISKKYAESVWCLDELDLMLKSKGKLIPVFFEVEPWELRHIEKGVYCDAFKIHQTRYSEEQIKKWKDALEFVSHVTGYKYIDFRNDDRLCKKITAAVWEEFDRGKPLYVAKYPVGLDKLVEDFEKFCSRVQTSDTNMKMVGIWGMEGGGKTTLAKELFNRKRSEYDGSCFLSDVANHEMRSLQYKLLRDLLRYPFESVHDGKTDLRHCLQRNRKLRFLVVIDDIDSKEQIHDILLSDVLKCDGLVIVTTSDKGLLTSAGISLCYPLKQMDSKYCRELFCCHAFDQPTPPQEYDRLVDEFVRACDGFPPDLLHLGWEVHGRTDQKYWESVLDEFRKGLRQQVQGTLERNFTKLRDNEQQIFMDTACFFIDKPKSIAMRIWEVSGWVPYSAFLNLEEKCLVDVKEDHREEFDEDNLAFRMNYHHRDFGRKRAKVSNSPHVRMWRSQDHKYLESRGFQDIVTKVDAHSYRFLHTFDFSRHSQITCFVGACHDSTTTNALIWLKLDLNGQKQRNIPPQIPLQNVQSLRIVYGALTRLWNKYGQAPLKLKELLLHEVEVDEWTESLQELKCVEKLVLRGRDNYDRKKNITVSSLSSSLTQLRKLKTLVFRHLGLEGPFLFSTSTPEFQMKSVEKIQISEEKHVRKVSICGSCCPAILSLHLQSMENLDTVNLLRLAKLKFLELRFCKNLKMLSATWTDSSSVEILRIRQCPEVILDFSFAGLSCLKRLAIDGCKKLQELTGIEQLQGLERLQLSTLGPRGVPNLVSKLQRLPSEITTLIGTAADEAESILTEKQFSDLIGGDASGIKFYPHHMFDASPESSNTVILCAVVNTKREEIIRIPLSPTDVIDSCIAAGKWIIIFAVTAKYSMIPRVSFGQAKIEKGCIITVNNESTLDILKRIVDQLYTT